jgi:hypothetical protein
LGSLLTFLLLGIFLLHSLLCLLFRSLCTCCRSSCLLFLLGILSIAFLGLHRLLAALLLFILSIAFLALGPLLGTLLLVYIILLLGLGC